MNLLAISLQALQDAYGITEVTFGDNMPDIVYLREPECPRCGHPWWGAQAGCERCSWPK